MIFSLHESIAPNTLDALETTSGREGQLDRVVSQPTAVLSHKIHEPSVGRLVDRPRVEALLKRSVESYPSTLLCGRAGTGKTSIAVAFARAAGAFRWYSLDSTDADWTTFAAGFAAAVGDGSPGQTVDVLSAPPTQADIARFLVNLFVNTYSVAENSSSIIVLDDIHHVFDASWFEDFFNLVLYSLPRETHLLLLCRSKPPTPLWRLRSKQMLNVLDEKVIAFDQDETAALFRSLGRTAGADEAHRRSYGRVSKLLQLASC
jgi:LuxR family maltose regulon positive regulatory protein